MSEAVAAVRAALESAAWTRWSAAHVHAVEGVDVRELLSRLSTQDLGPLAAGLGVTTAFLSPEGRVLHRVLLQPSEGGLRAVAESVPGTSLPDWVERYTFAEDCRWPPEPDLSALLVIGRAVAARAAAIGWRGLDSDGRQAAVGDLLVTRRPFGPLPSLVVTGPDAAIEEAARSLGEAAVSEIGEEGFGQLRIECGVPEAGAELDGERHLLEAGLRADASFEKGCYTGQEVVARQDTYDKVVRRLVGLVFPGRPEPGEELVSEEKRGCCVTSVGAEPSSESEPGPPCLGFVRSRHAREGEEVRTAGGLVGRVVELPFPRLRAGSPDPG